MSAGFKQIAHMRTRFRSLGAEELSRQIEAGEISDWWLGLAEEALPTLRREEAQEHANADSRALSTGARLEANTLAERVLWLSALALVAAMVALLKSFGVF